MKRFVSTSKLAVLAAVAATIISSSTQAQGCAFDPYPHSPMPYDGMTEHHTSGWVHFQWSTNVTILEADFENQPVDQPITPGGPENGQPVVVDPFITAIVRDEPMGSNCLELHDNDTYSAGYAGFEFLEQTEATGGKLTITADLWFDEPNSYSIYVREHGGAAYSFADLFFNPNGVAYCAGQSFEYSCGQVIHIQFSFDIDAGTMTLFVDGEYVVDHVPYGISERGIGGVYFGCTHDADLDGTLYVDNVAVTWIEPCDKLFDVYFNASETGNPALYYPVVTDCQCATGYMYMIDLECGRQYRWYVVTKTDAGEFTGPVWSFSTTACEPSCQLRGDANHDGMIDISDLVYLVNYMFGGGTPPPMMDEADINGDGSVDVADLVYLVNYMFGGGPEPVPCEESAGKMATPNISCHLETEYAHGSTTIWAVSSKPLGGLQFKASNHDGLLPRLVTLEALDLFATADSEDMPVGIFSQTGSAVIPEGRTELASIPGNVLIGEAIVATTNGGSIAVAVKEATNSGTLPGEFKLNQNYPNPFNPTTEISFSLPKPGPVKIEVYNMLGQKVTTLVDSYLEAGSHSATWDASNNSSGVYFYRMEADDFAATQRAVLLK